MNEHKYVYVFGGGTADGRSDMKNLLGGKGANLAEMAGLGIPVPAGFTITTEVCTYYYQHGQTYPEALQAQADAAMRRVEEVMGARFGDPENPLLVSVRSGARQSMPGMMETILNCGLCSATIPGLIAKTGNPRFVYDAYRRLIMMYADVVMEKAAGIEPEEGQGIRQKLDRMLDEVKKANGYASDADLSEDDLKALVERFKDEIRKSLGREFPDDANEQLWGAIGAVFASWQGKRAIAYRRIEGIPDEWGTAVNVQAMVFGNMGESSATGVAFTRNPATGENLFYGEWLVNAQGEDVVAGIRTPNPLNDDTKNDQNRHLPSLQSAMPETYAQLVEIRNNLESHYHDMQDIEFTVEDNKLWMLQTRNGKRTGFAAVRIAAEMLEEGLIDEREAVLRVDPAQLTQLLLPVFDREDKERAVSAGRQLAKGLNAGPGAATGAMVFSADEAVARAEKGEKVVLVRIETSPEDIQGMHAAEGILTSRGGMTSHAAVVARGMGKSCVAGCGALDIDYAAGEVRVAGRTLKAGDSISIDGITGEVFEGEIKVKPSEIVQVLIDEEMKAEERKKLEEARKRILAGEKFEVIDGTTASEKLGVHLNKVERKLYAWSRTPKFNHVVAFLKNEYYFVHEDVVEKYRDLYRQGYGEKELLDEIPALGTRDLVKAVARRLAELGRLPEREISVRERRERMRYES